MKLDALAARRGESEAAEFTNNRTVDAGYGDEARGSRRGSRDVFISSTGRVIRESPAGLKAARERRGGQFEF
jgi:hypothetical protein